MAGLIELGMLKGLGDSGAAVGNMILQGQQREDLQRLRDDDARQRQLDRLAVAGAGRSGSGSGGPFMADIAAGSMAEEMAAARMGMSVPEFQKFRGSQKTGDTSGYMEDTVVPEIHDTGDPYAPTITTTTEKRLPADFKKWQADKRKALADIQAELLYGDKYDDVAKGRGMELQNTVGSGIVSGAMKPAEGAEKIAAMKGEGAYGKGGVNAFTGQADDVGEATAGLKESQANKADRWAPGGGGGGGKAPGDTPEAKGARALVTSLNQEVNGLRKNLAKLREGFTTPAKQKQIEAGQAELDAKVRELAAARQRLAGGGAPADNGNVKSPAGVDPGRLSQFKVIR